MTDWLANSAAILPADWLATGAAILLADCLADSAAILPTDCLVPLHLSRQRSGLDCRLQHHSLGSILQLSGG